MLAPSPPGDAELLSKTLRILLTVLPGTNTATPPPFVKATLKSQNLTETHTSCCSDKGVALAKRGRGQRCARPQ